MCRRAVDLSVGVLLIVLAIPLIAAGALVSAVALRTWPFFVHDRLGVGGEPFRFVKIRTLPAATPSNIDKHQLDLTRVPRACLLLRRLHLDELPQLFHVVTGRMSLVGPRPEMAHLHEALPDDFARLRTSVRPGCTGLWQVSDACTDLISAAPQYDRFYLVHRSVRLDLWVLYRTALKMAGLRTCVGLEDVPAWAVRTSPPSLELIVGRDVQLDPVLLEQPAMSMSAAAGR